MKGLVTGTFVSECLLLYILVSYLAGFSLGLSADSEESIIGPRGSKGFVAHKGGSIRMVRDLTKNGTNNTITTGEIGITFVELREINSSYFQV